MTETFYITTKEQKDNGSGQIQCALIITHLHASKIIWIAIWMAIQKMYQFTQDFYCSIQQNTSHCCSLLHGNLRNIWIKIIQIVIQIECLHRAKLHDLDCDWDCDLDNFVPCKGGMIKICHTRLAAVVIIDVCADQKKAKLRWSSVAVRVYADWTRQDDIDGVVIV